MLKPSSCVEYFTQKNTKMFQEGKTVFEAYIIAATHTGSLDTAVVL